MFCNLSLDGGPLHQLQPSTVQPLRAAAAAHVPPVLAVPLFQAEVPSAQVGGVAHDAAGGEEGGSAVRNFNTY